jgi:hypothetical protein
MPRVELDKRRTWERRAGCQCFGGNRILLRAAVASMTSVAVSAPYRATDAAGSSRRILNPAVTYVNWRARGLLGVPTLGRSRSQSPNQDCGACCGKSLPGGPPRSGRTIPWMSAVARSGRLEAAWSPSFASAPEGGSPHDESWVFLASLMLLAILTWCGKPHEKARRRKGLVPTTLLVIATPASRRARAFTARHTAANATEDEQPPGALWGERECPCFVRVPWSKRSQMARQALSGSHKIAPMWTPETPWKPRVTCITCGTTTGCS